ncbi:MAG: DNA methyltransferase [bacterium]
MNKKYVDHSWDFRKANTKTYTNCFHSYPAMMIPQVASRLLDLYGKKTKLLFDPYCGTGTSLVEANVRGINAVGTDINPLARLVARAKTTVISLQVVDLYLKDFNDYLFKIKFAIPQNICLPVFQNIDFWFKKDTQEKLAIIKEYIEKIEDETVNIFFKAAFSETARRVSLTKNGEFKLVRIPKDKIDVFSPDVFGIMECKLSRNRTGLKEYMENKKGQAKSQIYDFNTVYGFPKNILAKNSVDLIATSPPYGDSRTTVAYGQFSRLSNQWLNIENANQIDTLSMGGRKIKNKIRFDFKPLDEAIEKIMVQDEKRAFDVISFYADYQKSIENITPSVKKQGLVAYVVGNRRVKDIELPTDEVTREFFTRNGLKHIKTIIRNIPNKRMPKKNSPTNEIGKKSTTMNREYIVILKKVPYPN